MTIYELHDQCKGADSLIFRFDQGVAAHHPGTHILSSPFKLSLDSLFDMLVLVHENLRTKKLNRDPSISLKSEGTPRKTRRKYTRSPSVSDLRLPQAHNIRKFVVDFHISWHPGRIGS